MLLAATSMNLGSVYLDGMPMVVSKIPHMTEMLKLPDKFVPIAAVAVGYPIGNPFTEKEINIETHINYIV